MELKEDLLYHIWKHRLFELPLVDLDDEIVDLVDPGQRNRDAGPDFFAAKFRSDGILWAGNAEIHRKASEWYQHGHHLDPSFDNVILHVVMDPDCQVCNSKGREIRTVRMAISPALRIRYTMLMDSPDFIPCWKELDRINRNRMNIWLERLLIERLEDRINRIRIILDQNGNNWEDVLYVMIARAFGQNINADPFEMLARSVSITYLQEHCKDRFSREALLFGQAGMLKNEITEGGAGGKLKLVGDRYYQDLCVRYRDLQGSLGLKPIDGYLWKFLRLRPDNFPTIRISQLAGYLGNYPDLFKRLSGIDDSLDFVLRMDIRASKYWISHYRFNHRSAPRVKRMGKSRLSGLYINAVLPVIMAWSRGNGKCCDIFEAQRIKNRIPAENNRIIRMWKNLGLEVPDVLYSQSLLQLTNYYCKFKRCLSCYVGSQIIQSFPEEK